MESTLLLVALNLGTVIVMILAVLFFGGIIFLASHSRSEPTGNQSATDETVAEKVTPITGSIRPVKTGNVHGQTPESSPPGHRKGRGGMHQASRA